MERERPSLTPEQERLLEECRAELATLDAKYGAEVVTAAWENRQAAPTAVESEIEPEAEPITSNEPPATTVETAREAVESTPELNAELQRLKEIIARADLPIYLEVHLNTGDKLLDAQVDNQRSGLHEGYNDFCINLTDISERSAMSIREGAERQVEQMTRVESATNGTLDVISMENVGPNGATAIHFSLQCIRPDSVGRRSPNFFTLYFTPSEAQEVLSILQDNDPSQVVDLIQQRIAPELSTISPHAPFTAVNLGKLTLPSEIIIPKKGLFGREERHPPTEREWVHLIANQPLQTQKIVTNRSVPA